MKRLIIAIIMFYRNHLSIMKLRCCRFHPSCSEYAIDALAKHGVLSGILKSAWRVLRCNPLSKGGYDPA